MRICSCFWLSRSWHFEVAAVLKQTQQVKQTSPSVCVCGVKSRFCAEAVTGEFSVCILTNSTSFPLTVASLRVSVWSCLVVGSSCW